MPKSSPDSPNNGDPTAADVFRVFRSTTQASIEGLQLLLGECADLRGELVAIHSLHINGDGDGVFSARQQVRILELQVAAKDLEALLVSLPGAADTEADNGEEQ